MDPSQPLTLALTHFNRFQFLIECITQVLNDPRIGEVVISDDRSTDTSYGDLLFWFQNESKVKLSQNKINLDCYRNKRAAVAKSTFPWAILFDSDNILTPAYLDALFALPKWEPNTIYCPEFAEPHFDYTAFAGMVVDRRNVASLMDRPQFTCLLNTANYMVPRAGYLGVWDGAVEPHTADSIYQAYRWLSAGNQLYVVPGLRYFHRIHKGSHYKQNCHKTGKFASRVEDKLRALK